MVGQVGGQSDKLFSLIKANAVMGRLKKILFYCRDQAEEKNARKYHV
jgi:hypothetical protein